VAEKRPGALLRRGSELFFLDGAGRAIAPYDPGAQAGELPLLSSLHPNEKELREAFAFLSEVAAVAPDWAAVTSEVELLGEDDYRLFTGALPFPLLVQRGELGARLAALRRLLPEIQRRYARLAGVDLRFARRIILIPIASAPRAVTPGDFHVRSGEWQSQSST